MQCAAGGGVHVIEAYRLVGQRGTGAQLWLGESGLAADSLALRSVILLSTELEHHGVCAAGDDRP